MSEEADRGSGKRTLALLKRIAEFGSEFTLGELASAVALPPSSVHRLLQPLLQEGLVERSHGQSYAVGSEFLRMAALVIRQADVGRHARPILRRLWSTWDETSSLCLYKPARHLAVVVETLQTAHPLRFVIEPYAEISLTWGSLGRAILAHLPEAEAKAAMRRRGLGPLSGLPAPTETELMAVSQEARAQGFAHYRNETVDVAGVAAPVRRSDGTILGSIGITAPARRLRTEIVPAMAVSVRSAADELSELMGYRVLSKQSRTPT